METFGENDIEVEEFGEGDEPVPDTTPKASISNWTRAGNQVKQGFTDLMTLPAAMHEPISNRVTGSRPKAPDRLVYDETTRKMNRVSVPDELLSENLKEKQAQYDRRRGMEPDRLLLDAKRSIDTNVFGADPNMPAPDEGTLARYIGAGGRMAVGNIAPAAGVVSKVPAGLRAITAGADTAAAFTGGVAGEFGSQIAPSLGLDPAVTGAAASMIGGVTPSVVTKPAVRMTSAVSKKGSELIDRFKNPEVATDKVKASVKDKVAAGITKIVEIDPAAEANLARSNELREKIPGFKPILANATGSKFVAELTRARARLSPAADRKLITTMESNKNAIEKFKDQAFPVGKVSDPTSPARQKYYQTLRSLEKSIDDVDGQLDELADNYRMASSADNRARIGSELRDLHARRRSAVKAIAEGKYQDVYKAAEAANVKVPVADIKTHINTTVAARPNAFQGKDMPGVFDDVLAVDKPEMSFEEFHSLWKRTNKELRIASRTGDANKIRFLSEFKDQLDQRLSAFEGEQFGAVAERLRNANSFYKKYDQTFKKGLGGELVSTNRFGQPVTADENVVHALIMNPRRGAKQIDDFMEIYDSAIDGVEGAANATKLLRDGVIDVFANEVVRNGKISQGAAERFIRKYDHVLQRMPDVKRELLSADTMNDALMTRMRELQARKTKMGQTVISRIAKIQPGEVDDFLYKNVGNEKIQNLLASTVAKDPEARKTMTRAVVDTFTRNPNSLDFFFKNKATLKPFLDKLAPGHFDNVETIVRANAMNADISPPTVIPPSGTADTLTDTIGTSARGVSSIMRAVTEGRSSLHDAIMYIGSRFVNKLRASEAERIIDEALFDPDVAKTLADIARKNEAAAKNRPAGVAAKATDMAKQFGGLITQDLEKHMFTLGLRGATFIGQRSTEDDQ